MLEMRNSCKILAAKPVRDHSADISKMKKFCQ
jgi:hypothetical protein